MMTSRPSSGGQPRGAESASVSLERSSGVATVSRERSKSVYLIEGHPQPVVVEGG